MHGACSLLTILFGWMGARMIEKWAGVIKGLNEVGVRSSTWNVLLAVIEISRDTIKLL